MPWTFYLRLLHSGPAHKPLVVYRCTAGTPQKPNLLSRDKANSAEESAMRTAVSKAITREQEHQQQLLPFPNRCYFSTTGARCPDQSHCGSEKKRKRVKRDNRDGDEANVFLNYQRVKVQDWCSALNYYHFLCSMTGFTNLELSHIKQEQCN